MAYSYNRNSAAPWFAGLVLLSSASCLAIAAQAPDRLQFNPAAWASDFVQAFYPEYKGKAVRPVLRSAARFGEESDFRQFELSLESFGEERKSSKDEAVAGGFSSRFRFRRDWLLSEWVTPAPASLLAARQRVEAHGNWNDEEVDHSLSKAGAEYPPQARDPFIQSLPLSELSLLLGDIRIADVEFLFQADGSTARYSLLVWRVEFDTVSAEGKRVTYSGLFEPFKGKPIQFGLLDTH